MKVHVLSLLFLTITFMGGCGLWEKDTELTIDNPVYANVFFEEKNPNGAPKQGIIAINYNNPKEFKLLVSDTASYRNIRISPNGEQLIYADNYHTGSSPQLSLYNTVTRQKELLYEKKETGERPLLGNGSIEVVWRRNSEGLYLTNPSNSSGRLLVLYYEYITQKIEIIKDSPPYAIYPLALISRDTLLIFSNENGSNFHLMDLQGEYITKLKNPYLELVNEGGLTKRGVSDLVWNDSLRLLTGSYLNPNKFKGRKIIVTDLEGTFFKEFTDGSFINRNPTWTKDGNIIFTEQRDFYDDQVRSELKIIDLKTEEIHSFFSREEYPKITGIGTSDQ